MDIITCPECGKEFPVSDPSRKFVFCRYCGTKIEVAAFITNHQQEPIITPPPKSPNYSTSNADSSVEELRRQHELELERLRYEHELELERLRHQNAMEHEQNEQKNAAPKSKESEHHSQNKTLGWHIGYFCGKHPVWAIILFLALISIVFGHSSV